MKARYRCPVCGNKNLEEPAYWGPGEGVGAASLYICLCCNFQYGYDDDAVGHSFASWRDQWIAEGMPWRGSTKKPKGYNPSEQLQHVDMNLVRRHAWEVEQP